MKQSIAIPALSDDEQVTFDLLWAQLQDRQDNNLLRASYYDGKRAIRQVGTVIPPTYYRLGIVLGWSAKAVDILARRCNLDRFVWPDGDLGSIGERDLWEANHLGAEVSSGLISSLIHGVSFLVTTRGDETVGEPPALIHAKDAMNATGEWNARARRLENLLSITGRDDQGKPTSFALYLDGSTVTAEKDDNGWAVDRQDHPWGVPAEVLVYKPRVGRPFGTSRISRPVMSLHDQALRTVIRMEGHADVYSFPEMWLLGADANIFKNADGTQKASWQVMLGRIKAIPDDDDAETPRADVKQFSASSPQPHIDQLKQQAQLFSGETSIPLTSLGVSDMSNPTSADSYIASREDLISEAEGATDDWAPALRRTLTKALAIANGLPDVPREWGSIDAKWRSPVYLSRAAAADAGAKQLAVVPWLADTEVGLELLGLDEQQIRRAMADKRRAAGRAVIEAIGALPDEARRALELVTTAAVNDASKLVVATADRSRDALLVGVPDVVAYYSDGSSALAADHYDDLRAAADATGGYVAEPVARLRDDKIRTGVLWSVEPLYRPEPDRVLTLSRLAEVVQLETARPFRDTITTNTRRDPAAVGWQRHTGGKGCSLCSMLAGRGAVYKQATAHFATHPNCKCSAAPVFDGQPGQEASVIQYVASSRTRTPQQQQALRDHLAAMP